MGKKCSEKDCKTQAVFSLNNSIKYYCSKHKTPDMIDLINKRCEFENCSSQPNFDIDGGKGKFCVKHKTPEMVDIKHKYCEFKDCSIRPTYNNIGEKVKFCSTHKKNGMIDVTKIPCEFEECMSRPNYDIKGGKGRFCAKHKKEDMIDVHHKTCIYSGCDIRPSYNLEGKKPEYCIKHKSSEMVDVVSIFCKYENCKTQPSYNYKDKERGEYCFTHKTPEMINLKMREICNFKGCISVQPRYNYKDNKKGIYCINHKLENMIDVRKTYCKNELCSTRAYYGLPGNPMTHCFQHREKGMIRRSNGKCLVCKVPAIYGTNFTPKHCEIHKKEDEQNIIEMPCSSCNLIMILDKNKKCEYCNPEIFKRNQLAKQNALMDYLNNRNLKGKSTDTIVNNGECGKERPDRVYETDSFVLILECDENQHNDRQCICEQTRMVNIGQSFGGLPVYFIRWNPDDYLAENEKKEPEILTKRYKLLGDFIDSILKRKITLPTALVSSFYMFYDGWNSLSDEKWNIITPFIL